MIATIARQGLLLVNVLAAAVWLPMIMGMVLDLRSVRTIILHSPVSSQFLYMEYVPSWLRDSLKDEEKRLTEHGMVHRTEDRTPISREAFEYQLPFIYSEGMRLRGLLPVTMNGREFDLDALRQGKTILGVSPADLARARLIPALHALLDARPDRVSLTFPEDRFRLRGGMEFVNADTNAPDPKLSEVFNQALGQAGFSFPARVAFGRDMILKPWDAGWFLLDAGGGLFNVRRMFDKPDVRRVALPPDTRVAHVQVQESRDRNVAALIVTEDDTVMLLMADMTVRALHCPGYDSARHNLKAVLDPVGETCIYDDARRITALRRPAGEQEPVTRLDLNVPSGGMGPGRIASWLLTPVRLDPTPESTVFVEPILSVGGVWSLLGSLCWGVVGAVCVGRRRGHGQALSGLVWGALGGAAGALAAWLWRPEA